MTPFEAIWVEVYRSSRHEMMYLYLPIANQPDEDAPPSADLTAIPEALLARFGRPVFSLTFQLSIQRKLAIADAETVLGSIRQQGFYLQMPPSPAMVQPGETPDAKNPHAN